MKRVCAGDFDQIQRDSRTKSKRSKPISHRNKSRDRRRFLAWAKGEGAIGTIVYWSILNRSQTC